MGRHASGATTTGPPGSFGDRWGEFRVTVEPAHEIGAWRLRGGRTRFRCARTIHDYITKAGHHSPGPIVEAVAVAGPRRPRTILDCYPRHLRPQGDKKTTNGALLPLPL